ncbi:hypothetical protein BC939DRAFT_470368 [Gamsiella multidivaricata]|uniref:uncharacterized protein n=1 Tax=Gamsiella multidivaricata TaxID=101098 RepID=UPI00221EED7D|nr:uncharacterized protein BC939DRAFT_470368 [Gamsiella multidivaricata]KAI7816092.1 hypothetical protein BC939DRAFT_470368 [Gamsiella multidivaricata]
MIYYLLCVIDILVQSGSKVITGDFLLTWGTRTTSSTQPPSVEDNGAAFSSSRTSLLTPQASTHCDDHCARGYVPLPQPEHPLPQVHDVCAMRRIPFVEAAPRQPVHEGGVRRVHRHVLALGTRIGFWIHELELELPWEQRRLVRRDGGDYGGRDVDRGG